MENILKVGAYYDGTHFAMGQRHLYKNELMGWLLFEKLHNLFEVWLNKRYQGFYMYKIIDSAFYQGLANSKDVDEPKLRSDRTNHQSLIRTGIRPVFYPINFQNKEKGIDVAMALDIYATCIRIKLDVVILFTADSDFIPLVRELSRLGIIVIITFFKYEYNLVDEIRESLCSENLIKSANDSIDIIKLKDDRDFKKMFTELFYKK